MVGLLTDIPLSSTTAPSAFISNHGLYNVGVCVFRSFYKYRRRASSKRFRNGQTQHLHTPNSPASAALLWSTFTVPSLSSHSRISQASALVNIPASTFPACPFPAAYISLRYPYTFPTSSLSSHPSPTGRELETPPVSLTNGFTSAHIRRGRPPLGRKAGPNRPEQ